MLDSVKGQLEALLCGLYEVVPPDLLSVFDYQELELLLCGIPDIDLDDWMRHTEYLSDYARLGARHRVVRWFWQSVGAMSREERVRMLQFTTGCSRLPAQGFKALQSNDGNYRKFNIQAISKKVTHLSSSPVLSFCVTRQARFRAYPNPNPNPNRGRMFVLAVTVYPNPNPNPNRERMFVLAVTVYPNPNPNPNRGRMFVLAVIVWRGGGDD